MQETVSPIGVQTRCRQGISYCLPQAFLGLEGHKTVALSRAVAAHMNDARRCQSMPDEQKQMMQMEVKCTAQRESGKQAALTVDLGGCIDQ